MAVNATTSPTSSEYLLTANMLALKDAISVYANDITNGETVGFKQELFRYKDYATHVGADQDATFALEDGTFRDTTQGGLMQTGGALDLAVAGSGYLSVQTPNGVAYTRNGQLTLNEENLLVDAFFNPVLDEGGGEIPIEEDILIATDGTISTLDGEVVARLGVFEFEDDQTLTRLGNNLYQAEVEPLPAENSDVIQGFLERSNVSTPLIMVRMQEALAAYQQEAALIKMNFESQTQSTQELITV